MLLKLIFYTIFFHSISTFGSEVDASIFKNWERSGGDDTSARYSSLSQINKKNITNLEKAWTFNSGFTSVDRDTVQTNPIFTGSLIITTSLDAKLIALNPESGKAVWTRKLPWPVGRRGLLYSKGFIYVPTGAGVYKINSHNGDVLKVFGNGTSYLPPVVENNTLYVANAIGGIEKYSITNGQKIWVQNLTSDCGAARVWSGFSFDAQLKQLYVATANSVATENIRGKNCLDNSIIAVDLGSGRLNWVFQEIINDKWDLDMVGSPIPFDFQVNGSVHPVRSVVGLSKTGSIFLIDAKSGHMLNSDIAKIKDAAGKNINITSSSIKIGALDFNMADLANESPGQHDYLMSKVKSFKRFEYNYPKIGEPVYFMGVHGGFEWPGAALFQPSNTLVVTSNAYPWIIRTEQNTRDLTLLNSLIAHSPNVSQLCINCHASDLMGRRHNELSENNVGAYVPAILDSAYRLNSLYSNLDNFKSAHKYAMLEMSPFLKDNDRAEFKEDQRLVSKVLKKIQRTFNSQYVSEISFKIYKALSKRPAINEKEIDSVLANIDNKKLNEVKHELIFIWDKLKKSNQLYSNAFWQPFTDMNEFPATKGPWGKLTAINLNNNKTLWQIPFGYEVDPVNGKRYKGSRNFGGASVTSSGVIFATGTVDGYARAFNLIDGQELWADKLPFTGSSPPMTYMYKGCQYVLFSSTGGRYPWFGKLGDATVAYRLKDCELSASSTN